MADEPTVPAWVLEKARLLDPHLDEERKKQVRDHGVSMLMDLAIIESIIEPCRNEKPVVGQMLTCSQRNTGLDARCSPCRARDRANDVRQNLAALCSWLGVYGVGS